LFGLQHLKIKKLFAARTAIYGPTAGPTPLPLAEKQKRVAT
jgi:hypothetical protein